jgi:hypothetical protein
VLNTQVLVAAPMADRRGAHGAAAATGGGRRIHGVAAADWALDPRGGGGGLGGWHGAAAADWGRAHGELADWGEGARGGGGLWGRGGLVFFQLTADWGGRGGRARWVGAWERSEGRHEPSAGRATGGKATGPDGFTYHFFLLFILFRSRDNRRTKKAIPSKIEKCSKLQTLCREELLCEDAGKSSEKARQR